MNDGTAPRRSGAYDLAVVGAGSAGFSAAITAAELGARVALIGRGAIGGTCVNVGCVPSKALVRAAEALHGAAAANRFDGIEATARLTDWSALVRQKRSLVETLRAAKYIDVLPRHANIDYLEGDAAFGAGGRLTVNGVALAAPRVILATGSRPRVPPIPGLDDIPALDSTAALDLETLPGSMIVLGAGYVGVELAQIFARAGVAVTLVSRRGLLPGAEPEIAAALGACLGDEGIALARVESYQRVEAEGEGVALTVRAGGEVRRLQAGRLLLAAGRVPATGGLNLAAAGIDVAAGGGIAVDDTLRTANPRVWAAGDVTGRDPFVYMAAYGARLAAQNAVGGATLAYDNSFMPAVVFSDPQAASVGMTEAAARSAGHDVATAVLSLDHVPRALAARDTRGLIKLVADRPSRRLLGAHILAPEGGDSIQTAAMALKAGMTYTDLAATIFPYLTTVEGLKLAAQTFEKDVAALSCCAG